MPAHLAREVRRLAVPAILHSLLQTLVFVVDRIMLGQHSEASLAAMQIGGSFEWSIWSIFAAFEVGTIARVGRHVGAGDPRAARRAALVSFALAVAFGTLVALATPGIVALLPRVATRVSPAALGEAAAYLETTIAATPLVFVAVTSIAVLQAGGDTRTPLAIGIGANVIHIGLNRLLILGGGGIPAMGARGAGISTAVTFTIEAALTTLALTSRGRPVSLRRPAGAATETSEAVRAEAVALLKIGGPSFVERILYHVGFLSYSLLITRLGDAAMAANQSLISIESICFLSADGFGVAAAALVAQKLGADKPEEARQAAWIAMRYAVGSLTLFGVLAFLARGIILPLFSDDPVVLGIGRETIWVLALAQPFMGTSIVLAQALRGAGRTKRALAVSIMGAIFVRLGATALFAIALPLGLVGVWLGSTTDWFVRTLVLRAMFGRTRFLESRDDLRPSDGERSDHSHTPDVG